MYSQYSQKFWFDNLFGGRFLLRDLKGQDNGRYNVHPKYWYTKYPFFRLKLVDTQLNESTNQNLIQVSKVDKPTNMQKNSRASKNRWKDWKIISFTFLRYRFKIILSSILNKKLLIFFWSGVIHLKKIVWPPMLFKNIIIVTKCLIVLHVRCTPWNQIINHDYFYWC